MGLLVEVENTRLEAAEGQEEDGISDPRHAGRFIKE